MLASAEAGLPEKEGESVLTTLGVVTLIVGVVLLAVGYVAEPRAVRPGWACVVIAVVLFLVAYIAPALHGSAL